MSETAWLTLLSPLLAGLIAGLGYLWRVRDKFYEKQVTKLELEIAAGRTKISELQDKALAALQIQLDEARKRSDTDLRVAVSLEQQTSTLKALAGIKE